MVELVTDVDWRERDRVLKLALPVDVHADEITSEIQFGHLKRSTHANTSWDAAHFEDYAHRWVHLGEAGYGVAIVNDTVYGHDSRTYERQGGGRSTTVRLTLLRGPRFPDPATDEGTHRFTVGVVPGADILAASRHGRALNLPLRAVGDAGGDVPRGATAPLVSIDTPRLAIESIKLADDRSGDVIVRLYEAVGGRTEGTLTTGFPLAAVQRCDLLERPVGDLVVDDAGVRLTLRAFEIVTLRLEPADRT